MTTIVTVFTGVLQSNSYEPVSVNGGVAAGDMITSVIELSPSLGTDRTSEFGAAAPDLAVLMQKAPVSTDFSSTTFIATLQRPE